MPASQPGAVHEFVSLSEKNDSQKDDEMLAASGGILMQNLRANSTVDPSILNEWVI